MCGILGFDYSSLETENIHSDDHTAFYPHADVDDFANWRGDFHDHVKNWGIDDILIWSVHKVKSTLGSCLQLTCFQWTAEECKGSRWWAGRCAVCVCVCVCVCWGGSLLWLLWRVQPLSTRVLIWALPASSDLSALKNANGAIVLMPGIISHSVWGKYGWHRQCHAYLAVFLHTCIAFIVHPSTGFWYWSVRIQRMCFFFCFF